MITQLAIPANALSVQEIEPFTALTFSTRATLRTIESYKHIPEQLYKEAERLGMVITGPIQYIYTGATGDETIEFELDIALPVASMEAQSPTFALKTFESFRCVSYTYVGPWDEMMEMYNALFATIHQTGYGVNQRVREVYAIVDFENPTNHVTHIQIGLA